MVSRRPKRRLPLTVRLPVCKSPIVSLNVSFQDSGYIVICLEFTLFLFRKERKEKKVLLRTLKLTKDFANSMYQGSTEIFSFIKKKEKTSYVYCHKQEEKSYKKKGIFGVF